MTILKELKARGILYDISNEKKFNDLKIGSAIYIGFDPTATSLHLGNYIQISILKRFESYGFKPIALIGGATGMIGDPSFKDSERKLLDNQTILENKSKIATQLKSFGLKIVDNYDWYRSMSIIDFLRDVGKMVNISYLLAKDSIKSRLDRGLSFTEFAYSLVQGWDFLHLYINNQVYLQLGGSDQWGNTTTGLDMISKKFGNDHKACVVTSNLLLDQNGNKVGKSTGGGNVWLDTKLTSPYNLYQYLLNSNDADVENYLKWFSFDSLEKLSTIIEEAKKTPHLKLAQKELAYQVVRDIHGEAQAQKAINISQALFSDNSKLLTLTAQDIEQLRGSIPFYTVSSKQTISEILINNKIVNSKRELKEFVENKAILFDLFSIEHVEKNVEFKHFGYKFIIVKRGKRNFFVLEKE